MTDRVPSGMLKPTHSHIIAPTPDIPPYLADFQLPWQFQPLWQVVTLCKVKMEENWESGVQKNRVWMPLHSVIQADLA